MNDSLRNESYTLWMIGVGILYGIITFGIHLQNHKKSGLDDEFLSIENVLPYTFNSYCPPQKLYAYLQNHKKFSYPLFNKWATRLKVNFKNSWHENIVKYEIFIFQRIDEDDTNYYEYNFTLTNNSLLTNFNKGTENLGLSMLVSYLEECSENTQK